MASQLQLVRFLFDRILSSLLFVYLPLAYGVYSIRPIIPPIVGHVLLILSILLPARLIVTSIIAEYKINQLGARAAAKRTWTPWNIGTIGEAVWFLLQRRNDQWWWKSFRTLGVDDAGNGAYTVESQTAGIRIIFTAHEENIKAILASQFNDFGKGPKFREEWKRFLGFSIFTTDGDLWHDSRALLRPQFVKDRVSDLEIFEHHVQKLIPMLGSTGFGQTVHADDLFFRFALDASTHFLLGSSVDSLANPAQGFAQAFGHLQKIHGMQSRAGPLKKLVPRGHYEQAIKTLNDFIGTYVDRALAVPPEELDKLSSRDEGYTFLHAIASYTRDRQVLRDQIVAVLLAGRDTTAVTLSWLFYQLSRHPEVVHKLRQEILTTVGKDQKPTYEHLKSMRYLQHSLNEILRLYPVVPYNVRVALNDTTIPRGGGPDGSQPIAVLKGTQVGYSALVLQRRKDVYPPASSGFPDITDFNPDRWSSWTPKTWTYVPFNGGPRICIGQQFALTEMGYTVVRILQTYDRIECRMDKAPEWKSDIVLQPYPYVAVAFVKDSEKQ